jgi:putative ABC transport system ATP-binding protein
MALIDADNIFKIYDVGGTKINAVDGISLKIEKGEFVSIVGKSGSGKSTLMHILGLLDTPTSGILKLNDQEVNKLNENKLAKIRNSEIGFVFQSFNLLPRTSALENVILPLKYSLLPSEEWTKRGEEMLELVGLSSRKNNKSNELSGGQKQRVAIARALVTKPSVIFADEPTGNLDSKTGEEIIELFKDLNRKGNTIVIVTHDDDLAKIAKRILTIKDGKLV